MSERTYWLDLFTGRTWEEFLEAGGNVSGFRDHRWKSVQRMKPGDYLLCYLTGLSRWIGILEVTSEGFQDDTPIWQDEVFPCRVKVKVVATLKPETGVPVRAMGERLSVFRNMTNPNNWQGPFRGSPTRWKPEDGEEVVKAVLEAEKNPVVRPYDRAQLQRRPAVFSTKKGPVTVPDRLDVVGEEQAVQEAHPAGDHTTTVTPERDYSDHTEIQYLLLRLGGDLGLDVWAARNDRNREYKGKRFADMPNMRSELPQQFDPVTNKTIQLIDVLWLRGNMIAAAFEIESTTSIYSGLLRMSDLIAMQLNLNIPLYLVAPDDKREKVIQEVNRPTFSLQLDPPLADICRFISFSALRQRIPEMESYVRYLRPDFLEELSESCQV